LEQRTHAATNRRIAGADMKSLQVVVSSANPAVAAELAASLRPHCPAIVVGKSLQETRAAIARHRATGVVVDLETLNLGEVEQLCREFPGTSVVCAHRLPDERMWTAALSAGAADCCHIADVASILKAVGSGSAPLVRSTAA
jgi:hypothetical protein